MHVLVPMDDSPLARTALRRALSLFPDADLTVLYVIDYVEERYGARMLLPKSELESRAQASAAGVFEWAREQADSEGVSLTTETRTGKPAREIVEYLETHDVDIVIMGSHGRSRVSRLVLGSVAETVLRRSPVPVTIVR